MEVHRRIRPQAPLHFDADDIRPEQLVDLRHDRVVTAHQRHGDVEVAGDGGVDPVLTHRDPVQPHVLNDPDVGVRQHRGGGPRAAVVAGEQDRANGLIQALEHAERLGTAADVPGLAMQGQRQQVPHAAVGIGDPHVLRASLERAGGGGVHLLGHQPPRPVILGGVVLDAGEGAAVGNRRVRPIDDAGRALHVCGDQHLHRGHPPGLKRSVRVSPRILNVTPTQRSASPGNMTMAGEVSRKSRPSANNIKINYGT